MDLRVTNKHTNKQTRYISALPVLVFLGLVALNRRDFLVRDDKIGFRQLLYTEFKKMLYHIFNDNTIK